MVLIYDVTLRDGEQAHGFGLNVRGKCSLAMLLDESGVDVIEAGFPASSDVDFESCRLIAAMTRQATVSCFARSTVSDVRRAANAVAGATNTRIHLFIPASDAHISRKLRSSRAEMLDRDVESVTYASGFFSEVQFGFEDATRADRGFLREAVHSVVNAGAQTVTIADTVGVATPADFATLISSVIETISNRNVIVSAHCHDDLGLATANSLAAVAAGARQVECTINGIGERAGNAALEEVVMALKTRPDAYPGDTGFDTRKLQELSTAICELTGTAVPPNKAIVGKNAFRHGAGVHQQGVMIDPKLYQVLRPDDVGAENIELRFNRHSGRKMLQQLFKEQGLSVSDVELHGVLNRLKSEVGKGHLSAKELKDRVLGFGLLTRDR